ncbi:MAG: DUF1579 domain-containing protein [Candidatus Omnitrophica bacterium]|nr:DUF1579 domain-containing protein [Candidatus Omnitrophota bacterium]
MKSLRAALTLTLLFMTFRSAGYAVDEVHPSPGTSGDTTVMDPVMMEKMKLLTTPGEPHKVLETFVGNWTYTGKFWMNPEAVAEDMTGTITNTLIFGGRFLKQEIEGPWMGETFQGIGYTGYDNVKGEYVSAWVDSVGTGIMTSSGQYDAATKTLTQSGSNSCPMTGDKARPGRSTWTVIDANHNTYTSYTVGPDGNEYKAMEIQYSRMP